MNESHSSIAKSARRHTSLGADEYFGVSAEARIAGTVTLTLSDYKPGFTVPSHAHARPYFCYVSAGDFREHGVGGSYSASRGMLLFHPATDTHADEFGEVGGRCFNIEVGAGVDIARGAGVVRGRAVRYAAELHREMRAWDAASEVVVEGLTAALVARVAFDHGRDVDREREHAATSVRRAPAELARTAERLRDDPCNPPSLELLASESGIGEIAFARAFRQQYGAGVGAFVRAERVKLARRELVESRKTVSAIAAELGFADQAHLTRVFRDATGWTPAAFRRAMLT
ncbi:MAG: AraC family transcriptional regulator [Gemmatimonadota bacterium]|nr:AraC family transcriptional regulator [Gemmatimonadota bacterium]